MENTILDTDERPRVYIPASAGLRFGGLLLDTLAYFASCFIGGILIVILGFDYILRDELYTNLFAIAIYFLYYILLESIIGRTLGKLATGTKVLNENDQKPSLLNIVGRTFCRLIPFDAFSFLGSGYGWHDSISNTKVIIVKEVKPKRSNKK